MKNKRLVIKSKLLLVYGIVMLLISTTLLTTSIAYNANSFDLPQWVILLIPVGLGYWTAFYGIYYGIILKHNNVKK